MKNLTRKIAVLALAGIMAMSLGACESEKASDDENTETTVADAQSDNNNADAQDDNNAAVNDNGGDESAPPAQNNNTAETFKDYSNKSVENGKTASWIWIDSGVEDILGDSEIFEITFKIKDGTADGNYNVVINDLQICNKNTEIVDAKIIDGVITVGAAEAPASETPSETSVSLVNTQGNAGDTITMKVNLAKNPGFCAVQMGINYDSSALEITNVTNTGILSNLGSVTLNLGE